MIFAVFPLKTKSWFLHFLRSNLMCVLYFMWKPDPSIRVATFFLIISSSSPISLTPAAFVSWDLPGHISVHTDYVVERGAQGTLGSTPGAHTWLHSPWASALPCEEDGSVCCLTPAVLISVTAFPGSWWWTRRPGMLQSMRSQRVGHDWVTELNW